MALFDVLYNERWRVLVGVLVVYIVRKLHVYNRLRQFKGPWGAPLPESAPTRSSPPTLTSGHTCTPNQATHAQSGSTRPPASNTKLRKEVDEAVKSGKAPIGKEGAITAAAVKGLPYLTAVIREGIRVWPPVVNLFPHDVPAGGDTIVVDGKEYFLPGGTEIGVSEQGMHHSKEIFGEDAPAFRPERWLEEGKDRLARMVKTSDLTFGHGRWSCLGRPIAQLELTKTIFEVIRHFDLASVNPSNPWRTQSPLGLFVINDMWVQVTARE
ncbi:hypothetical protein OQA88_9974 [Cercophora sp. LCS_1]